MREHHHMYSYDQLYPILIKALEAGDTLTWTRTVRKAASSKQRKLLRDADIPHGKHIERSYWLHRKLGTLQQLAHRVALTLSHEGERL